MISGNCRWFILAFNELALLSEAYYSEVDLLERANVSMNRFGATIFFFEQKYADQFDKQMNILLADQTGKKAIQGEQG